MREIRFGMLIGLLLIGGISGCGDGGPTLSEASGVVTYKGQPLSNANVIFQPQDGPIAIGLTDDQGQFTLRTGGHPGAVIGVHAVGITALEQGEQAVDTEGSEENNSASEVSPPKSRIPEKYGNPQSSGITQTISQSTAENDFKIELQD